MKFEFEFYKFTTLYIAELEREGNFIGAGIAKAVFQVFIKWYLES